MNDLCIASRCIRILSCVSGGIVQDIRPIFKAKVPVVKFLHYNTGIECDVSVENRDGIVKSHLLRILSRIDPRFRELCFLVCIVNYHPSENVSSSTLCCSS